MPDQLNIFEARKQKKYGICIVDGCIKENIIDQKCAENITGDLRNMEAMNFQQ